MNVLRKTSLAFAAMLTAAVLAGPAHAASKKILMLVWIGCEDVCKGVQDYVKENNIDAEVIVRDAAQDKSKLPGFVEEARAMRPDVVITWGTKVTLGMVGTLADQSNPQFLNDIPVVFTVVADPVGTKIIESYDKTGRPNVTGTRNRVPEPVNIKSIRRYMPGFDHLGVLYDRSEANSLRKVEELQGLTKDLNFTLDAIALDTLPDGTPAAESIKPKIDELKARGVQFLYLGSSTFLEKQRDAFTGAAVEAGLPVLVPYEHMVLESQALMSVAARDYDVGKLAARQASHILLEGKRAGDLPILAMEEFAYLVNMKVAKKLNLYPPVEFLQFVEQVN
jgi:putative ABC transport system substrate-binding protein